MHRIYRRHVRLDAYRRQVVGDLADDAPNAFLELEARFGLKRLDAGGG